jgi:hypothetical protein
LIKDAYFENVVVGFPQNQAIAADSKIAIANALSKGGVIGGNRHGSFNENEVIPERVRFNERDTHSGPPLSPWLP